jgi:hypothetical protein
VLVAIPIAIVEIALWVVLAMIILGIIFVLDIILFPFRLLYRKMYPAKKKEEKKEEESYY